MEQKISTITHLPQHIAFIMDGNRRWAKEQGLSASDGHKAGASMAEQVVEWCVENSIPHITLWALSTENWKKRNALELQVLFRLIDEIPKRCKKMQTNHVQVDFLGRRDTLPKEVQASLARSEAAMRIDNPKFFLHIAINYGGRDELTHACNTLHRTLPKEEHITEDMISQALYTKHIPDVDLIVRTGKVQRLSGLMPWQSVYAELFFSNYYWPAFSKEEFMNTLHYFDQIQRNFGA